jgi:hypothetical protein
VQMNYMPRKASQDGLGWGRLRPSHGQSAQQSQGYLQTLTPKVYLCGEGARPRVTLPQNGGELTGVQTSHRQDKARKPTDLVCLLQDHRNAQVAVPDHRQGPAQQQNDVPARLHHLKVCLVLHGPLHGHLKEDKAGKQG